MASQVYLDDNGTGVRRFVYVDRIFADGGVKASLMLMGGQVVTLAPGVPPLPQIWEMAGGFYHSGTLEPITDTEMLSRHGGMDGKTKKRAIEWAQASQGDQGPTVFIDEPAKPVNMQQDVTPGKQPDPTFGANNIGGRGNVSVGKDVTPAKKEIKIDSPQAFIAAGGKEVA